MKVGSTNYLVHSYDAKGRLTSLADDWDTQATQFTYDGADRLHRYSYDAAERLSQIQHTQGNNQPAKFAYTVDARGVIVP